MRIRRTGAVYSVEFDDDPVTPPPPTGFAGPTTVGPQAVVTDATLGAHTDQTGSMVDLGSADIAFTANNQTISLKKTTGRVVTNGFDNCTITNSDFNGIKAPTSGADSITATWCRIGEMDGRDKLVGTSVANEAQINNAAHQYGAVGKANVTLRRCELFGTVDAININAGTSYTYDCWVHDGYQWQLDPQQGTPNGTASSHVDMFQMVGTGNVTQVRFQRNRVDAWCFREGEGGRAAYYADATPRGTAWYSLDSLRRYTAGFIIHPLSYYATDILVSDNYFDGNVWSWFNLPGWNTATQLANGSIIIRDNVFKRRFTTAGQQPHQSYYGARSLLDVATNAQGLVTFYNNTDADTSAVIYRPGVINTAP